MFGDGWGWLGMFGDMVGWYVVKVVVGDIWIWLDLVGDGWEMVGYVEKAWI